MAIRVGIDATAAGEGLLRLAVSLSREHKAYLAAAYCMAADHAAAVSARAPVNPSPGIFVAPEVLTVRGEPAADPFPQSPTKRKLRTGFSTSFGMNCRGKASMARWQLFGSKRIGFIELAKAFDLTILGQLSPEGQSIGFPLDETVVASAGPVMVIPYAETIDSVGRRALIAWDGTREAVRAVHGALPLLDRAEAVTVIYVGAQKADLEQYRPSLSGFPVI